MAKTKTDKRAAMAADGARKAPVKSATVTNDRIALRAYERYLARDCEPGHALDDWLQAEIELGRPARSPDVHD